MYSNFSTDKWDSYDEDSVRFRPNPKANRPRTKIRPSHNSAVSGMVIGVDRRRIAVIIHSNSEEEKTVSCIRAREIAKKPIVTGDMVSIVGDLSGLEGSLARIVRVHDRKTILRRSADDSDTVERVVVANADQLVIVSATDNPEPRIGLIDRYLCAAVDAGIKAILCITKTDLKDANFLRSNYEELDLDIFEMDLIDTNASAESINSLLHVLYNKKTVFVGHSGVGKSTLINNLVPDARRITGRVNNVTGKGRHTSSSTVAFRLPKGANNETFHNTWVIDTPGVRSFGLGHIDPDNILKAFPKFYDLSSNCPKFCLHSNSTKNCNIIAHINSLEENEKSYLLERLKSIQRLLSALY